MLKSLMALEGGGETSAGWGIFGLCFSINLRIPFQRKVVRHSILIFASIAGRFYIWEAAAGPGLEYFCLLEQLERLISR